MQQRVIDLYSETNLRFSDLSYRMDTADSGNLYDHMVGAFMIIMQWEGPLDTNQYRDLIRDLEIAINEVESYLQHKQNQTIIHTS
jgi:hypothetical protein